jgi:hypothetical protein
MAVSPELYAENYPEGIEEDSYEKLLAHKIAHGLHIRILNGDEGRMGPTWFFEGFAIYAVEQFRESTCIPSQLRFARSYPVQNEQATRNTMTFSVFSPRR